MELSSLSKKVQEARAVLRPYQTRVVSTLIRNQRHLNYMDMGMGKSLCTLLAVIELEAFPCIIVASKSAMYVMEDELRKWFDEPAIVYAGKPKQRQDLFKQFTTKGHRFIITNYSLVGELGERFGIIPAHLSRGSGKGARGTISSATPPPGTKWHVGCLIADEIQLGGLFNHKTKTYKVFHKLAKAIPHVFLLTGTPYRRGVVDFFGPLSLIDPVKFDSYWKYVNRYCITIDSGFGKSIERQPKNVIEFRTMLRQYAVILNKKDHVKELPGKTRQAIQVEMFPEQARIYRELMDELYAETDSGELIMTPGILSRSVRLRQILACPQVLGLTERGAAIDTMIEMAGELVDRRKPFVVFTPFRQAVPFIAEAIRQEYSGIKIHEITGGLSAKEFGETWKGFQDGRGPRVLICVIKSGASFHATAADTAFFLGYEWDFNQNEQCEDRLNRIGQTNPVTCYYLMHKGTIDDDVTQRLNDKKYVANLLLSSEQDFVKMISKGRSN